MSFARRHFEKTSAARAAATASGLVAALKGAAPAMPADSPALGQYQQLLIALGEDLRQLQDIASIEAKIERKRTLIGRYRAWVEGALSAETAVQDEIVANILVWAIDVADWPYAIGIARHVIEHGLAMPERYSRKPAAVIAEQVAEAGLKKPAQVDLATLRQVAELTAGSDMHDQIRAKLEKALGMALQEQADVFDAEAESAVAGGKPALLSAAHAHFCRALELDKSVGVKKLIEALERELKKFAQPPGDPA